MPFVIGSAIIIYFMRDFIIHLLFAKSFGAMNGMFAWQLIGDCFKINYMLAYLMLAKAKTSIFMTTEIIFGISFPLLSYLFINLIGANGCRYGICFELFDLFCIICYVIQKGYLF